MPVLYQPQTPYVPLQVGQWPQVIVEAAFAPAAAAVGGSDLLLGDTTQGMLGVDVLGSGNTWADISSYVLEGTLSRTWTRQQGPLVTYQAGTATLRLNNSDGRFDPANLAGPYVSAGVSQVRPMIPIRVRVAWDGVIYPVWQGFATSWVPPSENFGPVYDETTLSCSDAFRVFTGVTLPATSSPVGGGDDAGARIARVLAAAGWYSAARGMAALAAGVSHLQATTYGSDALSLMQLAADSEAGELYMDRAGRVTFRNRHAALTETRSTVVQGIFGGRPTGPVTTMTGDTYASTYTGTYPGTTTVTQELPCTTLTRPADDTTLANDIQATSAGLTLQEAQDADSVATYLFPRTYSRSDLILTTDADTLAWANWVLALAKSDEFRIDEVTITPGQDPGNLFPHALGRDLGDRIQVWKRPPNVAAWSKDLFIRGITHTFRPRWWQTTWQTQTALRFSFLTLDDPTLGALGANALAF